MSRSCDGRRRDRASSPGSGCRSHRSGPTSSIAWKRRSRVLRGSEDRGVRRFKGRRARWLALTPGCSSRSRAARPSARTRSRNWPVRRSELLLAVARVSATLGAPVEDRRGVMVDLLRRRLGTHEDAVLAGEVTYCVWSEQAEAPAVRMRRAIRPPACPADRAIPNLTLLALRTASVDFASLLVQLAANAAASGQAGGAPEEPSAELAAKLSSVIGELASRAQQVKRPVSDRVDVVAHHLAAGLRVPVPQDTLQRLGAISIGRVADRTLLDRLRDPWLRLATNEYTAVAALDDQLTTPTCERSERLASAIADAAANVICGARLAGRPAAFRHRCAWRHQAVALTYALEAYAAGLQGHAPSLAQAQRITLTRLVRAHGRDRADRPRPRSPPRGDVALAAQTAARTTTFCLLLFCRARRSTPMGRLRRRGSACHAHAPRSRSSPSTGRLPPASDQVTQRAIRTTVEKTGGADTRASSTPSRTPMSSSLRARARTRTLIHASVTTSDHDARAWRAPMPNRDSPRRPGQLPTGPHLQPPFRGQRARRTFAGSPTRPLSCGHAGEAAAGSTAAVRSQSRNYR